MWAQFSFDLKKSYRRENLAICQIKPTVVIWIKTHISGEQEQKPNPRPRKYKPLCCEVVLKGNLVNYSLATFVQY